MLRPSALSTANNSNSNNNNDKKKNDGRNTGNGRPTYDKYKKSRSSYVHSFKIFILCSASFLFSVTVRNNIMLPTNINPLNTVDLNKYDTSKTTLNSIQVPSNVNLKSASTSDSFSETTAVANLINRAKLHEQHCNSIGLTFDDNKDYSEIGLNNHTAHLKQWGFLKAVRTYEAAKDTKKNDYPYECRLPPEIECQETHFTVVFMAYNPDRLQKMMNQIKKMLTASTDDDFSKIVAEVVIVWNGSRDINETDLGKKLIELGQSLPLRISYPLKEGFRNDLLNRYHPRLQIKTKAIMYYDDDGPFYSYKATLGGFELWKRNSNVQIGAMARKLDLGPRQIDESNMVLDEPADQFFVSQCPTDEIHYNYNTFTNFHARMVLPSGSFLHSNYLCFLFHPIFEEIREYVRTHPVNPDDGTVSMIVSQLAGRAPKVYSRRINEKKQQTVQGRRLMDGIDWDAKGAHSKKMNWGRLRSDVANSLARYFGSLNSGSIGWCNGTQYHVKRKKEEVCDPEMAKVGMLPWLKPDHTAKDTCP